MFAIFSRSSACGTVTLAVVAGVPELVPYLGVSCHVTALVLGLIAGPSEAAVESHYRLYLW